MKNLTERQKAFEEKFARDEMLQFKAEAFRNRAVALWAAQRMGLSEADSAAYVKAVQAADMEEAGDDDVMRKLMADFAKADVAISQEDIRAQMDKALADAKAKLMEGA